MKKTLKYLTIFSIGLIMAATFSTALATTVCLGQSGCTGIGTAMSADVGKVLEVSGYSPLTYSFITPATGSGTVTSITASSPLTGGTITTTGSIGCQIANGSQAGCLSSANWNTFNNKQSALSFSDSIANTSGTITLVGDTANPADSQYYGTNSGGSLGYYNLPSSAVWGSITGTLSSQTDLQTALNAKQANLSLIKGTYVDGDGCTYTSSGTLLNCNTALTSGTVTSVGVSSPNSTLTIGSTPVTSSGTITADINLGNANTWTGAQTFNTSAPIIGTATASTIAGFDSSKNLISLATSTYPSLTELSYVKGVTSAIQTQINGKQATGSYITALTGDATASGPGSAAITLATVNTNTGSFGSSTSIPSFTVNGKGLITAASGNAVIAPAGTLSGTTLASSVVTSSLTTVGTIGTGVSQGNPVGTSYGGTGATSVAAGFNNLSPMTTGGDLIYGGASGAATRLANGNSGQVLTSAGTTLAPTWQTPTTGTVTSVTSADGNATVATTTTTPVITIVSAPKLQNARTIAGVSFDGTGNIAIASTGLSDTANIAYLNGTQSFTGINTFTPTARTSGVASYLTINAPADTGITASTESKGINIVGATRTWADGTVATQREIFIGAPTYNKTTTSATFTNAGTLVLGGAPIAGSGVTFTNGPYSLWTQAGNNLLERDSLNGATIGNATDSAYLNDPTVATVNTQQPSPTLELGGNGWKTNATAGSQPVSWIIQDSPTQHAANPGNDLVLTPKDNGVLGTTITLCDLTTSTAGGLMELDGLGCQNPILTGANTGLGAVNAGQMFGVFNNNTEMENFNVNGMGLKSTNQLMWFSGAAGNATSGDTAITRDAPGVVQINNGTNGTYADLKLRNVVQTGKTTTYNGIATVSGGVPSELGTADLTAQTAAVTTTTLYTPANSGMFRISGVLQVTTAATASSILGGTTGVVITYTEPDGSVAQSVTMALNNQGGIQITPSTGNTGNTTTTNSEGDLIINAKSGTAIQYAIGYSSTGLTPMQFAAHLKIEAL